MSRAELEIIECAAGTDPLPAFERAWSRGARVLPLSPSLPAVARERILARASVAHCEPAPGVVLATSGSSGEPRLIDLSLDALRASAVLGARSVPFGPGDAWHTSLAPTHVGGLMIHMRARVLGGAVLHGAPPRRWSDLDGATHVSLVAAQLGRLLEDSAAPPASLKAVLLGGGPSPQSLRDAAIWRGVPLFATYGLTETSSQVATGRLSVGDPATLAGPAIAGVALTVGEADEILVDGPVLARGELRDGAIVPLPRPYPTRDAGFIDTEGRVHIVGRLDSMFISGGRNIHPETIERALASIPEVRAACVIGVPHERWGMRPVAFVDLASRPARPLRESLRDMLEPHLVPDAVLAMPKSEADAMKPGRARLGALHASGAAGPPIE